MNHSDQALTVTQANAVIREVLSMSLPSPVRIRGEVSNFSGRRGGGTHHWFFSLKDESATLRCVCFASQAARVKVDMRDGVEVICSGRVDLYPAQGQVQLYIDKIEAVGEGALEAKLRQLIEKLRNQGWFDEAHKKPLPEVPRKVAVVTSRAAAALQDVINTVSQRWPGCELVLIDVPVQGEAAAPGVAKAIRGLSLHGQSLGIDAVIVTRGGGSIEDLWAFNDEAVAQAVWECDLPVVAAIGHETDVTVVELVADRRAATPTQAAMLLVPDREALRQQLDYTASRLTSALKRRVDRQRDRLDRMTQSRVIKQPHILIADRRLAVTRLAKRLAGAPGRVLERKSQQLLALTKHLEAVHPSRVLERGFTYTTDDQGKLLRSADSAKSATSLTTHFHDGEVTTHSEAAVASNLSTASPSPLTPSSSPPTRRKRRKPPSDPMGSLFESQDS